MCVRTGRVQASKQPTLHTQAKSTLMVPPSGKIHQQLDKQLLERFNKTCQLSFTDFTQLDAGQDLFNQVTTTSIQNKCEFRDKFQDRRMECLLQVTEEDHILRHSGKKMEKYYTGRPWYNSFLVDCSQVNTVNEIDPNDKVVLQFFT